MTQTKCSPQRAAYLRHYYWKKHQETQGITKQGSIPFIFRGFVWIGKQIAKAFMSFNNLCDAADIQEAMESQKKMAITKIQQETAKKVFITAKGEEVKSRVEKEIADFLYTQKIAYQYEKPKTIAGGKVIHPDFYLEEHDVYIEYFGMLGNAKYNFTIALKEATFEKENMRVIKLYPNNYRNLGYTIKKRFEAVTHKTFPQRAFIPYNAI